MWKPETVCCDILKLELITKTKVFYTRFERQTDRKSKCSITENTELPDNFNKNKGCLIVSLQLTAVDLSISVDFFRLNVDWRAFFACSPNSISGTYKELSPSMDEVALLSISEVDIKCWRTCVQLYITTQVKNFVRHDHNYCRRQRPKFKKKF